MLRPKYDSKQKTFLFVVQFEQAALSTGVFCSFSSKSSALFWSFPVSRSTRVALLFIIKVFISTLILWLKLVAKTTKCLHKFTATKAFWSCWLCCSSTISISALPSNLFKSFKYRPTLVISSRELSLNVKLKTNPSNNRQKQRKIMHSNIK